MNHLIQMIPNFVYNYTLGTIAEKRVGNFTYLIGKSFSTPDNDHELKKHCISSHKGRNVACVRKVI